MSFDVSCFEFSVSLSGKKEEVHSFLRTFARAKVRSIPELFALSGPAVVDAQMGFHVGMCCGPRVRIVPSLDRRGHPGVDDDLPTELDVLGDFCRAPFAVV